MQKVVNNNNINTLRSKKSNENVPTVDINAILEDWFAPIEEQRQRDLERTVKRMKLDERGDG